MSDWIDGGTDPDHIGVYEVRVPGLPRRAFAKWTGQHWTNWGPSIEHASRCYWKGIRTGYDWRMPPLAIPARAGLSVR